MYMENQRIKNKNVKIFCLSCLEGITANVFQAKDFLICPHCHFQMIITRTKNNIFHLQSYQEVA